MTPTKYPSTFVLGIVDGDELLTFGVFQDADKALEYHCKPENFCTHSLPDLFQCVVLFPTLKDQFGDLTLMYAGAQCIIYKDDSRPFNQRFTFDFVNWESLYHAIARAQTALSNTNFTKDVEPETDDPISALMGWKSHPVNG
jgi:hypothetical protein